MWIGLVNDRIHLFASKGCLRARDLMLKRNDRRDSAPSGASSAAVETLVAVYESVRSVRRISTLERTAILEIV